MSRNIRTLVLAVVVACFGLVAAFLLRAHRSPGLAASLPVVIMGTPGAVYDAILPEIRDRVAQETKIVRVDRREGLLMRFSVYLEDHSVRLVEIDLRADSPERCVATLTSRQFSFMPWRSRDAQDVTLENSLADLIRRRAGSVAPPQ